MYFERRDIEASLDVIAARSAPGSTLVVMYIAPALLLHIVGAAVKRVGEPLKTVLSADEMHALLAAHGFEATSDADIPTLAAHLAPELTRTTSMMSHARIVVAKAQRTRRGVVVAPLPSRGLAEPQAGRQEQRVQHTPIVRDLLVGEQRSASSRVKSAPARHVGFLSRFFGSTPGVSTHGVVRITSSRSAHRHMRRSVS